MVASLDSSSGTVFSAESSSDTVSVSSPILFPRSEILDPHLSNSSLTLSPTVSMSSDAIPTASRDTAMDSAEAAIFDSTEETFSFALSSFAVAESHCSLRAFSSSLVITPSRGDAMFGWSREPHTGQGQPFSSLDARIPACDM